MSCILRALVITLLMATGVAAGEEPGCKTVTNQHWGFSVCYPSDWHNGEAAKHLENAFFKDGERLEAPNSFSFSLVRKKEGRVTFIGIAEVDAHRAKPKTFEEFSNYFREGAKAFGEKMNPPTKIMVNGLEGFDVTMDNDEGKAKTRIVVFYARGNGYRLTMWSGPEQGAHEKLAPVFEQFVKSFRILK